MKANEIELQIATLKLEIVQHEISILEKKNLIDDLKKTLAEVKKKNKIKK